MAMNSQRNRLVLTLIRNLDLIPAEVVVAAASECDRDGLNVDDHLLALGLLSDPAHSTLRRVLDALVNAHSGLISAIEVLSTDASTDKKRETDRHDLGETLTSAGIDETHSFATPQVHDERTRIDVAAHGGGPKDQQHAANPVRYRFLSEHARGGLGKVSRAFDEELKREVALKEIQERYGADRESQRRFVTEAEVTGQLEHPGVVPVYSLGRNEKGRPFYAMRFIRGESLKETVDDFHGRASRDLDSAGTGSGGSVDYRSVEFRKLLGRMTDTCQAVEYAHSRGVLHRDLKPSNVMLGPYGETLVVDWGLAKVIGRADDSTSAQSGTDGTTRPQSGAIASDSEAAETKLGAIMGTPRFMSPEQALGQNETLGPASDIYSLGAMLFYLLTGAHSVQGNGAREIVGMVAQGKALSPRQIDDRVPRPLDAICRKAMALDANDRYQTANEISEEIERWMADEAVSAHRDSLIVRSQRWVRKHQTLATSISASVSVAVVGLAIGLIVFAGLNQQLEAANGDLITANELESKLRLQAEKSEANAVARKKDADANFQLATDAVEKYLTEIDDDVELAQNSFYELRSRLLRTAIPFYEQFIAKRGNDDILDTFHAHAYFRLGVIHADLGDHDLAIEHYESAQKIYRQLYEAETSVQQAINGLARSHNNLGNLLRRVGRADDAAEQHEVGRKMLSDLTAKNPDNAEFQNGLAQSLHNLGVLASDRGDPAEAQRWLEQAVEMEERLLKSEPSNAFYRLLAARSGNSLAIAFFQQGKPDQAIQAQVSALRDSELPPSGDDRGIERRAIRAAIYHNLGLVKSQQGKIDEAKQNYTSSLDISQKLVREVPRVPEFRNQLAASHTNLGNLYRNENEPALGESHQQAALEVMDRLVSDFPEVTHYRLQFGGTLCNVGNALSQENPNDALERYEQSIATLSPLVEVSEQDTANPTAKLFLRNAHWGKAQTLDREGNYSDAAQAYLSAASLADASLTQTLKARAAYVSAQAKDVDAVAELARELLTSAEPNAAAFVECAKAVALCSDPDQETRGQSDSLPDAMKLLTTAEERGYFEDASHVEDLMTNADLESVRTLESFTDLVERVSR